MHAKYFSLVIELVLFYLLQLQSVSCSILSEIIQRHFVNCVIVHVGIHSSGSEDLAFLQTETAGHYIASLNSSVRYDGSRDNPKLTRCRCALVIVDFYKYDLTTFEIPGISSWLFKALTPRYIPLIRKDEDHFAFVCDHDHQSNCDALAMSSNFGAKVKFKNIVIMGESEENTLVKMIEPFGKDGGIPKFGQEYRWKAGNFLEKHALFPDYTQTLNGKEFRVSFPKVAFHFEVKKTESGEYRALRGLYKVWLEEISQIINSTYIFIPSSFGGGTGKRLGNGTWVGTMGDVLYGQADMGILVGHIEDRHPFVDWSSTITYEWMIYVTHNPQTYFAASTIFRPFPPLLWIGFVGTICAICLAFLSFSPYLREMNLQSREKLRVENLLEYLIASLFEMDAQYYLRTNMHTIRSLLSFWLFFAMILATVYRSKLVSLIAFPDSSWVPSKFDELAISHFKVGLNVIGKGGASYSTFSSSKSTTYKMLFSRMELFPDPAKCLLQALLRDMGCIMWKNNAEYVKAKHFSGRVGSNHLKFSSQPTTFISDGYIWEKRAIFRHRIDQVTSMMMATGLISYWHKADLEYVRKMGSKRKESETTDNDNIIMSHVNKLSENSGGPHKLKILQFVGLFAVFFINNALSLAIFVVEVMYANWKYRHRATG